MRRLLALSVLTLVAFAPTVEARDGQRCHPHGATIAAANARVVVYRVPVKGFEKESRWYGCDMRSGRRTRVADGLVDQYATSEPTIVRVRGRLAALADQFEAKSGGANYTAWTYDLRSGRRIRRYDSNGARVYALDVRMARSGSLAVIEGEGRPRADSASGFVVRKIERGGSTVLGGGDDVEPQSLAVGGGWVYWTQAGGARSAPID
jgi:hypothetical protein